jgi:pimeloyl-ACP methyl ester carboxylesterase
MTSPPVARPWLVLFALGAALGLAGCARLLPTPRTPVPMKMLELPLAGRESRCLVVLLPGRFDHPKDFVAADFRGMAERAGVAADFLAVDANLGYYRKQIILDRLREDVIRPARAKGYETIWLAGISLGGTGSILYALQQPGEVDGLLLLAPFLGDEKVIAEVEAAGGPGRWTPPAGMPIAQDFQRALWTFVHQAATAPSRTPPIYLSYGADDPFARPGALFGAILPPKRVFVARGDHDWPAWKSGWEWFLRSGALPRRRTAAC